jgi:hypothetical protein
VFERVFCCTIKNKKAKDKKRILFNFINQSTKENFLTNLRLP